MSMIDEIGGLPDFIPQNMREYASSHYSAIDIAWSCTDVVNTYGLNISIAVRMMQYCEVCQKCGVNSFFDSPLDMRWNINHSHRWKRMYMPIFECAIEMSQIKDAKHILESKFKEEIIERKTPVKMIETKILENVIQ